MQVINLSNLEAEMKRKGISRSDIARTLNVSYRTIHSKFNGESEWSYADCVKVRNKYFPNMLLEYLFRLDSSDNKGKAVVPSVSKIQRSDSADKDKEVV